MQEHIIKAIAEAFEEWSKKRKTDRTIEFTRPKQLHDSRSSSTMQRLCNFAVSLRTRTGEKRKNEGISIITRPQRERALVCAMSRENHKNNTLTSFTLFFLICINTPLRHIGFVNTIAKEGKPMQHMASVFHSDLTRRE